VCTKNAEGLIHNAENQITQMDAGAAVYGYDGEGRRMKKTVGSETTYYFYGPGGLLCEFSTSNTISSATAASSTDKTLYRTSDKLGSAVLIINSSGLVIENNRTLPYGEAWQAESTPSTNEKKFTTYQRDQESGLDYAMDRYYGNSAGRFNSPDKGRFTLGIPSSLNRYTYSGSDPINHIDPSGKEPMLVPSEADCSFFGGVLLGTTSWNDEPYYVCDIPTPARETGMVPGIAAASTQAPTVLPVQTVGDGFMLALEALKKKDCAELFNTSGTGLSPAELLTNIYQGTNKYGNLIITTDRSKVSGDATISYGTYVATVNGQQVFDKIDILLYGPTMQNFSDKEQARTLLHELGHVFNFLAGAGGSAFENDVNPDGSTNRAAEQRNLDREKKCVP
jgi:RHS repeat-associated protein